MLEAFAGERDDEWIVLIPKEAARLVPSGLRVETYSSGDSTRASLAFELRDSARLAARLGGEALFCLQESVPWRSPIPVVAESIGRPLRELDGPQRLTSAVRRASLGGAAAVFVCDDLSAPARLPTARRVPPVVSPAFHPHPAVATNLGEGDYVLAWACGRRGLARLMAAWTWVDGSVGDTVSLALICANTRIMQEAVASASSLGLKASVRLIGQENVADLPNLFRHARVYLAVEGGPIPQALRWALASGVPIVAESSSEAGDISGDAAYLVPPAEPRALGAAALTVLVEEEVAERLRTRGVERARAYAPHKALSARLQILRSVVER
jgi:Glycosyl transferases group 1